MRKTQSLAGPEEQERNDRHSLVLPRMERMWGQRDRQSAEVAEERAGFDQEYPEWVAQEEATERQSKGPERSAQVGEPVARLGTGGAGVGERRICEDCSCAPCPSPPPLRRKAVGLAEFWDPH